MSSNLTLCNNCAGKVVLSLGEFMMVEGLTFCCVECAEAFASPDDAESFPCGLAFDLGIEDGGS